MLNRVKVKMLHRQPLPVDEAGVFFDGERLSICGVPIELKEHAIPNPAGGAKHKRLSAICPNCGASVYTLYFDDTTIGCCRWNCLKDGLPAKAVETGGWG